MDISIIGKRITEERKRQGLTQEKLAEKLGVSPQAVSKWENGWNLPDIDNINSLSEILSIPITNLFDESGIDAEFIYRDRLFDESKMFTRMRTVAQTERFDETYRALTYMRESHKGQVRKKMKHSSELVPYINHPLMMGLHAYYLGIRDDSILAAILLHDVVEDTEITLDELPFTDEIKEIILLVTFSLPEGMDKEQAKKVYYEKIKGNGKACVVKVIDRCNNVSTMAASFSRNKMIEYVRETEEYVMPLLEELKAFYPEYADMTFVVKYHIVSILETVKHLV